MRGDLENDIRCYFLVEHVSYSFTQTQIELPISAIRVKRHFISYGKNIKKLLERPLFCF